MGRAGEAGAYPAEMIDVGPRELASPARRLSGFLIDYIVITAVAVIAIAIFGARAWVSPCRSCWSTPCTTSGAPRVWGRTLGKLAVHTEVVRRDGIAPPDSGSP